MDYSFWKSWFAQPEEGKLAYLRTPGKGGYYPSGEYPGFSGKPDPKEYFHYRVGHFDMDPETSGTFMRCYTNARAWLKDRGLLSALDFGPEHCVLRVLHYFPTPDGHVGEAHRDFDLLTVSVPGTVPGLEAYRPCPGDDCGHPCRKCGGAYGGHDVPDCREFGGRFECVCPGAWTSAEGGIQVGEMLEIYSDHLTEHGLRATTHRIRVPPMTERYSAAFFMLPPDDFLLRPGYTARQYLDEVLAKAGTLKIGAEE